MKIELSRFLRVSTPMHSMDFLPRQLGAARAYRDHLKKRGFRAKLDKMVRIIANRGKLSPPMTEKEFAERMKKLSAK